MARRLDVGGRLFFRDTAAYYYVANRNKRGLVLDLKSPGGYEKFRHLAQSADVVLHNFTDGVAERLKVDYDSVRAINDGCVYCAIAGFGPEQPERPAYDMIMQGLAGIMSVTGSGDGLPTRLGLPISDIAAGLFSATAIVAALYERRGGAERPRSVNVSLYDSAIALLANHAMAWLLAKKLPVASRQDHPQLAPYGVFKTRSGYITLAVGSDAQFKRLCEAIGLGPLARVPMFKSNANRVEHHARLRKVLEDELALRSASEWEALLGALNVPCGVVRSVPEVLEGEVGRLVAVVEGDEGPIPQVLGPIRLDGRYLDVYLAPPALGDLGLLSSGEGG